MKNYKLKALSIQESKHINGGRWAGPVTALIYEIVDVITTNGENVKQAYQNGRKAGCQGKCN
jgi:hypothetical protein